MSEPGPDEGSSRLLRTLDSQATHPLAAALHAIVGDGGLLLGDAVRQRLTQAIEPEPLAARVLVRPADTAQVAAVLGLCNSHGCPVVAHGGLTGLVHGTDAGADEVVVSLERMNAVEEISPTQRVAVVQAGVPLQRVQEAAAAAGLFFPLDLGARGSATIGGAVSTNAGGNRVLRWGTMRNSVLGLEVVLADGTVLGSMNRMLKNNTGYDLKQLFIGAEGTLGIVTGAVLRLREAPRGRAVALLALDRFEAVVSLLKHMDSASAGTLSAFEVMWESFYHLVTTPPSRGRAPLPHGHRYYVLLECMGLAQPAFEAALAEAMETGAVVDASIAQSERECEELWGLREDVAQMGRFGRPFAYDISLPLTATETYTEALPRALGARWPDHHCWFYGHLGDGNLHVVVQVPHTDTAAAHAAVDALVYAPLADGSVRGSISAEHGIGLDKKGWLHVSRSAAELALMHTLKAALDPRGILNPGKLLP